MSLRLRPDSPLYKLFIKNILADKARTSGRVVELVSKMIDLISIYSDKAVFAYNRELDNISSRLMRIRVHGSLAGIDLRTLFKIKAVYDRILNYHANQSLNKSFYIEAGGAKLFLGYKPLSSVGIYIPADSSTYISTMLMNAIPAYIAGVKDIYNYTLS